MNLINSNLELTYILKNSAKNAFIFAIIWGCWAWWVNSSHGNEAALRASLTQISFTIVNAFVYSVLMEGLFFVIRPVKLRNIMTFLIPNIAVSVLLTATHMWRGTPNVLATAAAPLCVTFLLSLLYIVVVGPKRLEQFAS
ncbi:hypothetical protein PsAD2_03484 [Pseudovibrio axinellae]|uniref:Uncharacterized protein n=1 Tax=Pseudovibrio axinellae TaxID=989403 RepID=A0A165W9R2_9HYPH|nr:hypothetical protein [Pseudovibrio axinellae]KZL16259.1 hypothetical protein PsAD2_03484 [Pseudovibrio axinellae]SER79315.1 hypothetical protein SAMN05421798_1242 [Pseudovibrio axinellae]